jgi:acyl carrier protein
MTTDEAQATIIQVVLEILQDKGRREPELGADTVLLGGQLGIDSLDLAVVVIRMGELAAKEPFENGFIDFRTIGDMAELYAG